MLRSCFNYTSDFEGSGMFWDWWKLLSLSPSLPMATVSGTFSEMVSFSFLGTWRQKPFGVAWALQAIFRIGVANQHKSFRIAMTCEITRLDKTTGSPFHLGKYCCCVSFEELQLVLPPLWGCLALPHRVWKNDRFLWTIFTDWRLYWRYRKINKFLKVCIHCTCTEHGKTFLHLDLWVIESPIYSILTKHIVSQEQPLSLGIAHRGLGTKNINPLRFSSNLWPCDTCSSALALANFSFNSATSKQHRQQGRSCRSLST